jgi:hypothetical protein
MVDYLLIQLAFIGYTWRHQILAERTKTGG